MRRRKKYKYTQYKQGKYNPVNKEKYSGKHTPEYRSSWELKFFKWCDKNDNVLQWSSESVIVPYKIPSANRLHRYYVDGTVIIKEGKTIKNYLVEIKPLRSEERPVGKHSRSRGNAKHEKKNSKKGP